MAKVHISIEILDRVTPNETRKVKIRLEYEHVNLQMIYDINMDENITIKTILVAD